MTTTGHPYHVWREHYGYKDAAKARAEYAEYQRQLEILTPEPETEKRGPGRPKTGKALSPAEKQKRYRERQRKAEMELAGQASTADKFHRQYVESQQALAKAQGENLYLEQELAKALAEIERLKGNVT